jgi:hypothetical protein
MLTALREWSQKRTLRTMLKDPRSTRGSVPPDSLKKALAPTALLPSDFY